MDVRINEVTSNIHATDARAMLTPEVLSQIIEAVLRRLEVENRLQKEREHDTRIGPSTTETD